MKIYNYDKETKELISISEARENPLEAGEFLIPAFATGLEPLVQKADNRIIFNNEKWEYEPITKYYKYDEEFIFIEEIKSYIPLASSSILEVLAPQVDKIIILKNDVWEYSEDNRGKNYWLKSDGSKVEFILGTLLSDTMTDKEPLFDFPLWDVNLDDSLSKWIAEPVETFAKAQETKIALIDSTTKASIIELAGSLENQSNLQAKSTQLSLKEFRGTLTNQTEIDQLAYIENLYVQVENLVNDGNAKEVQASTLLLSDFNTLELALVALEGI